jgi:hypothetical protein
MQNFLIFNLVEGKVTGGLLKVNIISPFQKLMCPIHFHFLLVHLVLHNGVLYVKLQCLYYVRIFFVVDDPEMLERYSLDDSHYVTDYYYYHHHHKHPHSAEIYSSLLQWIFLHSQ